MGKLSDENKRKFAELAKTQKKFGGNFENFMKKISTVDENNGVFPNIGFYTEMFRPVSPGKKPILVNNGWEDVKQYKKNGVDFTVSIKNGSLTQYDLTVLLYMVKMADEELKASFTKRSLLKFMGLSFGTLNYEEITESLDRISTVFFKIHCVKQIEGKKRPRKATFRGPMFYYVDDMDEDYDDVGGDYYNETETEIGKGQIISVQFNPRFKKLIEEANWSFINLEQRKLLKKKQTALAFHGFLSSNNCPAGGIKYGKTLLMKWFGKPDHKNLNDFMRFFRRGVIQPLEKIGFLVDYCEDKNSVLLSWKR